MADLLGQILKEQGKSRVSGPYVLVSGTVMGKKVHLFGENHTHPNLCPSGGEVIAIHELLRLMFERDHDTHFIPEVHPYRCISDADNHMIRLVLKFVAFALLPPTQRQDPSRQELWWEGMPLPELDRLALHPRLTLGDYRTMIYGTLIKHHMDLFGELPSKPQEWSIKVMHFISEMRSFDIAREILCHPMFARLKLDAGPRAVRSLVEVARRYMFDVSLHRLYPVPLFYETDQQRQDLLTFQGHYPQVNCALVHVGRPGEDIRLQISRMFVGHLADRINLYIMDFLNCLQILASPHRTVVSYTGAHHTYDMKFQLTKAGLMQVSSINHSRSEEGEEVSCLVFKDEDDVGPQPDWTFSYEDRPAVVQLILIGQTQDDDTPVFLVESGELVGGIVDHDAPGLETVRPGADVRFVIGPDEIPIIHGKTDNLIDTRPVQAYVERRDGRTYYLQEMSFPLRPPRYPQRRLTS